MLKFVFQKGLLLGFVCTFFFVLSNLDALAGGKKKGEGEEKTQRKTKQIQLKEVDESFNSIEDSSDCYSPRTPYVEKYGELFTHLNPSESQNLLGKANEGDEKAQEMIINKFLRGTFRIDFKQVEREKWIYLQRELERDDGCAYFALKLYDSEEITEKFPNFLNNLIARAKDGKRFAQNLLWFIYFNGCVVEQNYPEALHWLKCGADETNPRDLFRLGYMYGLLEDYKSSGDYFQRASVLGCLPAKFNLALMYKKGLFSGKFTEEDDQKSVALLRELARDGHIKAMVSLGLMILCGRGIEEEELLNKEQIALGWFKEAALRGNSKAKFNTALLLFQCRGVPEPTEENITLAHDLMREAANEGYTRARKYLGLTE